MRKLPPLTARRPPRALGFTLTELLIVVTVLAILVALLLPVLGRARYLARATCCISNHRQVLIGLTTYAADYGGAYPAKSPLGGSYLPARWRDNNGSWDLHRVAEDYLGAPDTFFCPVSLPVSRDWFYKTFCDSDPSYVGSMDVYAGFYALNAGQSGAPTVPETEFAKCVSETKDHRPLTGDNVFDHSPTAWGELWLAPHHWRSEYHRTKWNLVSPADSARGPCLPTDLNNPYGYPDGSVRTSRAFEIYFQFSWGLHYWAAPPKP